LVADIVTVFSNGGVAGNPNSKNPVNHNYTVSLNAAHGFTGFSNWDSTGEASAIDPLSSYKLGDSGPAVKAIKFALFQRDFLSADEYINFPSKFTEATKEAVTSFQSKHGIPANGVVMARTLLSLGLLDLERVKAASAAVDAECIHRGHEVSTPSYVSLDRSFTYICSRCGSKVVLRPDQSLYAGLVMDLSTKANHLRAAIRIAKGNDHDSVIATFADQAIRVLAELKAVNELVEAELESTTSVLEAGKVAAEMLKDLIADA
jgi:peptidoglycan hydrolase-like protein with peptidoglycan-binding domain